MAPELYSVADGNVAGCCARQPGGFGISAGRVFRAAPVGRSCGRTYVETEEPGLRCQVSGKTQPPRVAEPCVSVCGQTLMLAGFEKGTTSLAAEKSIFPRGSRTSAAKAGSESKPVIAAV